MLFIFLFISFIKLIKEHNTNHDKEVRNEMRKYWPNTNTGTQPLM